MQFRRAGSNRDRQSFNRPRRRAFKRIGQLMRLRGCASSASAVSTDTSRAVTHAVEDQCRAITRRSSHGRAGVVVTRSGGTVRVHLLARWRTIAASRQANSDFRAVDVLQCLAVPGRSCRTARNQRKRRTKNA
jgi:hypothetical protein